MRMSQIRDRRNPLWLLFLVAPFLIPAVLLAAPPSYSVQWVTVGVLRFDGNATARACYVVKTKPAGHEGQVQWTASAQGGTVSPTAGQGKVFEIVVTVKDPKKFQLTVKAGPLTHKVKASALTASDIQLRANQLPAQPFHRRLDENGVGIDGPSSAAMAFLPMPYSKGFPVALANGEARLDVTDLYVPSRGIPFIWRRTYSPLANFDSVYGFNWTNAYDRQILIVTGGVSLADGLGREDFYQDTGGGTYAAPPGLFDRLVLSGGVWTQTDAQGMKYMYSAAGWLTQIQDRAGNTMTITRNAHNHISQIEDTQGRLYTVAYTNSGPNQKFQSLTDFSGRVLVYGLDGNGDLFTVRSPIVVGTPNGNDFPSGKTTLYGYTSGFADARLNHNLTQIVQPLYNVGDDLALSKPMVVFSYSPATSDTAVDFDHVASQRWGHDQGGPPSAPNLVVGGTITLAYSNSLGGDPDAPVGATVRTTQTDANGNISAHYFDAAREEIRRIERTNRSIRPGEGDYTSNCAFTAEGLPSECFMARGNSVAYLFDAANPRREGKGDLLEIRRKDNALGSLVDLVTRFTREPVFHRLRTTTDPRAFPTGIPPMSGGHLDLADPLVARYTTTNIFDYQEGTGFQASRGIDPTEQIPEGLGDQNGAADFDEGNVVEIRHPVIQTAGPNLGQVSVEERTWNDRAQVLTEKEGEGHVRSYVYFLSNEVPNDPNDREGYLFSVTMDSGMAPLHFNLTTQYQRNVRGVPTGIIDPKGRLASFFVNDLDQTLRATSRPIEKPAGGIYVGFSDSFFNANDDLTSTSEQNLKEDGTPYPHASVVNTFEHDILHNRVAENLDKSKNDNSVVGTVRTEHLFDLNLNEIATRHPMAVSGAQPSNIDTVLIDERDLPYKETRGDNDTNPTNAPPANAPHFTQNYDANRNHLETIDAVRNAVRVGAPVSLFPGSGAGDVTRVTRDGFDREVSSLNGEGDLREKAWDLASNLIQEKLTGPVDHTAGAQVRLLAQTDIVVDERERVVSVDRSHFVTETGVTIGDGHSIHLMAYDRDNKKTAETDDNGKTTVTEWDSADRREKVIDPLLNETEWVRDLNSNVHTIIRREVSSDIGSPVATLVSTQAHDGEDRLIQTVSATSDIVDIVLDFRGNTVLTSDGVRGSGQPAGPGNKVSRTFDALRRELSTTRLMTSNGRGDGAPIGQIVTQKAWDDSSRRSSETDDGSRTTSYQHDGADRQDRITFADSTFETVIWDADSQEIQKTDANNTVQTQVFEGRGLLLDRTIQTGSGVLGATEEHRRWDGAMRQTLTQQNDIQNTGLKDRAFKWDSLSNQVQDKQLGTYLVDREFDGEGNALRTTYPGNFGAGRFSVLMAFDGRNRVKAISSEVVGALAPQTVLPLSNHHYRGKVCPCEERVNFGSDLSPLFTTNATFDMFPRIQVLESQTGPAASVGAGQLITCFEYGHDRASRKLYEKRTHDLNKASVYRSDSAYRIVAELQNLDFSVMPPGSQPDAWALTSPDRFEQVLSGSGDRESTLAVAANVGTATTYTMSPAHASTHKISSVAGEINHTFQWGAQGFPSLLRHILNPTYLGQQTAACDPATNALIAYGLEGVGGYRYGKYDKSGGEEGAYLAPAEETIFLWDGDVLIEERDKATNAVKRQYVWGPGTDRLVQTRTASGTYWAFLNDQDTVEALADPSGAVVERYSYGLYGKRTVTLNGNTGNRIGFHGAYHDLDVGLIRMRERSLDPVLGRWVQRDPKGFWGDSANLGNPYAFVGNNPVNNRDPYGQNGEKNSPTGTDKPVKKASFAEAAPLQNVDKSKTVAELTKMMSGMDMGLLYGVTIPILNVDPTVSHKFESPSCCICEITAIDISLSLEIYVGKDVEQKPYRKSFIPRGYTEKHERKHEADVLQLYSDTVIRQKFNDLVHSSWEERARTDAQCAAACKATAKSKTDSIRDIFYREVKRRGDEYDEAELKGLRARQHREARGGTP